jgi:hypothetical protein
VQRRGERGAACRSGAEGDMNETQLLLLLIPVIIIELGLLVVALRDLLRPERRVRGDSKLMWGIIIVVVNIIGPILYLAIGREEE